ncbi:MAG: AMP-binding protein [Pseudomonadales bacterium]|nr:AMP-binding protein [Pseudomonadales bacterium]MCP5357237.1 AMP-binding protein [Pseudomonadales bacterium]
MNAAQAIELTGDLDPTRFSRLSDMYAYAFATYRDLPAFSALGHTLSYGELEALSDEFCLYLQQHDTLKPGDRIAIQLPNILQFPIAAIGALKAGLVLVNTNPLYTAREMRHQFRDAGVKAVVILSNFADKLESILADTDIETIITTDIGDALPPLKRFVVNTAARYLKKMVPDYSLPHAVRWHRIITGKQVQRPVALTDSGTDVAIILYTGGTTGVSKGAMLTHSNLLANMMQLRAVSKTVIHDGRDSIIGPLPLYHTYAFMMHCLAMIYAGNHTVLVPNPRDINSVIKEMKTTRPNGFLGINTLYLALCRHPRIREVDFSQLRFCGAGGMALTVNVAKEWTQLTGCEVFEGYGLTECSPVVSVNLPGHVKLGTVGFAVPETEVRVVDDDGKTLANGEKGELWVRGPQVMKGYWHNDDATADSITKDGWFKTGDFAQLDDEGYIRIVDRKKELIIVSGFNVFPSEVEEVVNAHPDVFESAAIGLPCEKTGEKVKLFVVPRNARLNVDMVKQYCRENLTAYKVPKEIVFVNELPKSNVGKILRRELREQELAHLKTNTDAGV